MIKNKLDFKKLAEEFEVSISTVKRWKSGIAKPSPRVRRLIEKYLKDDVRNK